MLVTTIRGWSIFQQSLEQLEPLAEILVVQHALAGARFVGRKGVDRQIAEQGQVAR